MRLRSDDLDRDCAGLAITLWLVIGGLSSLSLKDDILPMLAFALLLVFPVWGLVRGIGAIFSARLRRYIASRPILHITWFLLAITAFGFLFGPFSFPHKPGHTFYHQMDAAFYWRVTLSGHGREIARQNGIIFYYVPLRHGPTYCSISEAEVNGTRDAALGELVDAIALYDDGTADAPLVRGEILTGHHADNTDAFADWWRGARDHFEFDPAVVVRYKDYENLRFRETQDSAFLERIEARKRELERRKKDEIARGFYRTYPLP
jgi:hypothetical protein